MSSTVPRKIENEGDFLILGSDSKYENVEIIKNWNEDIITNASLSKEFRWGTDGISWSNWINLSLNNLRHYIDYGDNKSFWLEFKVELLESKPVTINEMSLNVKYVNKKWENFRPFPIAYAREKGNHYYPLHIQEFTYQPLKIQAPAIKLQKDLSYIANQMHGVDITYFKADPVIESQDPLLLEWGLLQHREGICLKVVVPNNEFPDNKFNFNAFGLDFEIPFEVHIDKRYFEWHFENAEGPQKGDAIYIPLNDRMYTIESSTLERNFMAEPIFWKITLKKYQKQSHILQSEELEEQIDEYTTGIEEVLGENKEKAKEDLTNEQQLNEKTTVHDPIREYINNINSFIVQENLENYHTTIAQYYYDLQLSFNQYKDYETAVRYKNINNFSTTDNRSFTCWFRERNIREISKDISSVSLSGNELTVNFQYGLPTKLINHYIRITDSNNNNFVLFGKIKEVKNNKNKPEFYLVIDIDEELLTLAYQNFPAWESSSNLVGTNSAKRNFLYGYNTDNLKGIQIDTFNHEWIRLTINNVHSWIKMPHVTINKWYGLVINLLNQFQQISIHIYDRKDNSLKTTKLNKIWEHNINNVPISDRTSNTKFSLLSSPIHLTNIRLLSKPLEEENHSLFLNMNILKDSSEALIIDNAIPRLKLPYIGDVK